MLLAAQLQPAAAGTFTHSLPQNQPCAARISTRGWLPAPKSQVLPCHSAIQVACSAKRGRKPRSESAASPPPEQEVVVMEPADVSPQGAPAGRRRPKSTGRSKTEDVEGHEGLVTLTSATEASDNAVRATEFYAEQQVEEALHLQQEQAELGLGLHQPAELSYQPSGQFATIADGDLEVETGSYGVAAGLPEDSHEKTVLREQIGHDIYRQLRSDAQETATLPRKYRPVSGGLREYYDLRFNLEKGPVGQFDVMYNSRHSCRHYQWRKMYWESRQAHREFVHDLGFAAHHYTRERAVNIYANIRRVAGLMAAFENDDHKLQNLAPSNIASWARAEIVFYPEHEEFNQMLRDNMEQIVKRPPKEAEEEEIDLLDEALFLLRPDDDNATSQRVGQQGAEQELLDKYLEGVLPGATLDNLSATYAQDIFNSEMDDYVDEEALFGKPAEAKADDGAGDAQEEEQAVV